MIHILISMVWGQNAYGYMHVMIWSILTNVIACCAQLCPPAANLLKFLLFNAVLVLCAAFRNCSHRLYLWSNNKYGSQSTEKMWCSFSSLTQENWDVLPWKRCLDLGGPGVYKILCEYGSSCIMITTICYCQINRAKQTYDYVW